MTKKTLQGLASPAFSISSNEVRSLHGVQVHYVTIKDKYDHRRYAVERRLFLTFTNALQSYLKKRPHIDFSSKRNVARSLTYLPAGIKTWSAYMPGAFATHPVHNPEVKRLAHDQKIDFMTRRLFRHSVDAIGLRNRAHILAWAVQQQSLTGRKRVWLSLAAGSGQHVYDTLNLLDQHKPYDVVISDINEEVLGFAEKIYQVQRPKVREIEFKKIDVLSPDLATQLESNPPTVVDAMGLVEYLDSHQVEQLVRQLFESLVEGGMIAFTNMSPEHPHLDLHQRGLGWPGVKPRTIKDMVDIVERAGVPLENLTVFKSQDKVYGVYIIRKGLGV